jgi:hypothetical protein
MVSTHETTSRQIPFPIRSPASRWPLGGTGDTARAAEGHSLSLADASWVPEPGQGVRISVGDPAPSLLIPPSAPRQFGDLRPGGWEPLEDLAGRGGQTRGPRLEAKLLRAEGSTNRWFVGRGFGEGQGCWEELQLHPSYSTRLCGLGGARRPSGGSTAGGPHDFSSRGDRRPGHRPRRRGVRVSPRSARRRSGRPPFPGTRWERSCRRRSSPR